MTDTFIDPRPKMVDFVPLKKVRSPRDMIGMVREKRRATTPTVNLMDGGRGKIMYAEVVLESFEHDEKPLRSVNEVRANLYVVYSYGSHYPMYVYDYMANVWLGNKDRSTRTTNRHMSMVQPVSWENRDQIMWMDTETLKDIIQARGLGESTMNRLRDK